MSNQQKIFALLEQQKQLEIDIENCGVTKVKALVKRLIKNQRQINALLAMEVFNNG